jgi:hypothetical protein
MKKAIVCISKTIIVTHGIEDDFLKELFQKAYLYANKLLLQNNSQGIPDEDIYIPGIGEDLMKHISDNDTLKDYAKYFSIPNLTDCTGKVEFFIYKRNEKYNWPEVYVHRLSVNTIESLQLRVELITHPLVLLDSIGDKILLAEEYNNDSDAYKFQSIEDKNNYYFRTFFIKLTDDIRFGEYIHFK